MRGIDRASDLLQRLQVPAVYEDVAAELETKAEHARQSGSVGGTIQVRVSTRRGSESIPNWQVLHVLKIFDPQTSQPTAFPALSTPTQTNMPPGRYWIWAGIRLPDERASA